MKNLLNINSICKPEPGLLYAVDLAMISSKSLLKSNDVKIININELLNTKTSNSYVVLENAGSNFYFLSSKIAASKPKKTNQIVQNVNSSRVSLTGPQIISKPSVSNINNEERVTVKRIRNTI